MPGIKTRVIAWTCVGAFIATAVIKMLALVGVIVVAEKKSLGRLFELLIPKSSSASPSSATG